MRWLLNVLSNRYFLIGFGFLLGIALVLVLGASFEWSLTVRLLGIILVLVLFIGILVVSMLRANRSADLIERSIKQQAEQQLISTRPDRRGEIEELQQQLNEAIDQLKSSKLGKGKRGRAALYALPWYMFIGPPGAGKTTAIANSGLNFPLGTDRIRGVGGTRNCDWFFSDQAILLDTAGRYMTEQEDTEEWLAFLTTLKEQRAQRPINGVIVGIGLPELLEASPDEVEWHADNIRRRIDELIKHLGVKFPVYLVLTKTDLLQGFVEFFGELTRREREQIWGATLEQEQQKQSDLRTVFEQEYDRLYETLIRRRTARLSRPMKRAERQKVYAFPLQFSLLKDNMSRFVGRLFQPNPYQESPTFRGFYFTSGTQEGVPLDRVIQAIANQFDLPPTMDDDFSMQSEAKSYFIKDFFTDVVVQDQYMVRRTSKASKQGSAMRIGVTVASVVLLLLFLLGASQAFLRGRANLNGAKEVAAAAGLIRWDDPGSSADNFGRLERIETEVEELDDLDLLSLGLHRDGTVIDPLERLYVDNARGFVNEYPLRKIRVRLQEKGRSGNLEGSEREQVYEDLKAYLLTTSEVSRLEDENQYTFLRRYLTDVAAEDLKPYLNMPTDGELRARIEKPIDAYLESLQRDTSMAFVVDDRLVNRSRQIIFEPPSIASIYNRLRREGNELLPPFTLENEVPGRYRDLFVGNPEVSGFYTKQGWDTFVAEAIEEESRDPTGDDWVLGRTEGEIPAELQNRELVAQRLEEQYFSEYASEWQRFLRSIRLARFQNVSQASRAMNDLSDASDSPIIHILGKVTQQTTFTGALDNLADQAAEGVGRAIQRRASRVLRGNAELPDRQQQVHPVEARFQWLHNLQADRGPSGGASQELYQAFEGLREVSGALDGMASDPTAAAEYVASVLSQNGGDLATEQRGIRSALRNFDSEARDPLFIDPLIRSWEIMLGIAQQYLNERWREVVYQPFQQRFANQYPFDATSDLDAPTFDVEEYFNPESGAVAVFLEEELSPYFGRDFSKPRAWEGRGIRLSSATTQAIERARSIGDNLYDGGAMRVEFEMQAEVPERTTNAPAVDQVSISVHGRDDTYGLGSFRPWVEYVWPGRPGAMVSISTQTGDLQPKRFEGDWALFRMLQQANITRRTSASFEMRWPFEQAGQWTITALYNLRTRRAGNPFNDPRGFFNFRPPSSLN